MEYLSSRLYFGHSAEFCNPDFAPSYFILEQPGFCSKLLHIEATWVLLQVTSYWSNLGSAPSYFILEQPRFCSKLLHIGATQILLQVTLYWRLLHIGATQ
ncbi:16311_t:CDS:2, partial [Cetraspora pellucida]